MLIKTRVLIFTLCLALLLGTGPTPLPAAENTGPKVIMVIMDYIDISDLANADIPVIEELAQKSSTGLMNFRARNRYPSSAYLSLALGSRALAPIGSENLFHAEEYIYEMPHIFKTGEETITAGDLYRRFTGDPVEPGQIVNLYIEPLRRVAQRSTPPASYSELGDFAAAMDLRIAVLGNADSMTSINRNAALMAIDVKGTVPGGRIDTATTESSPYSLGGVRTDHAAFLAAFDELYPVGDILILDLGDTTRVERNRANCSDEMVLWHRKTALERNDALLGLLLQRIDLEQTMIMILSPNPSREMIARGNFGLGPVIVYHPEHGEGLITSATTRRAGIITNMDILPTITSYWPGEPALNSGGSVISNVQGDHSLSAVDSHLNLLTDIRTHRAPLHNVFILLALLSIIGGIWIYLKKNHRFAPYFQVILSATLLTPLIILLLRFSGYPGKMLTASLLLGSALLLGVLLNRFIRLPLTRLILITGITALVLSLDCITGSPLMLYSVLGSDAIAGGRYYGIGNDYMGILLSTSLIFICLLLARTAASPALLSRTLALVFIMLVALVIGSPQFGANIGGFASTLITAGILFFILSPKKLNLKKSALVLGVSILLVLLMAIIDARYSSTPSHAGRAIASLLDGGAAVFLAIIRTKLGILGNTIANSAWTYVLLASIFIMGFLAWIHHSQKNNDLAALFSQPAAITAMFKILFISGIVVFIFNDTGVIAAAFIFMYLLSSFWLAWEQALVKQKGGKADA